MAAVAEELTPLVYLVIQASRLPMALALRAPAPTLRAAPQPFFSLVVISSVARLAVAESLAVARQAVASWLVRHVNLARLEDYNYQKMSVRLVRNTIHRDHPARVLGPHRHHKTY